MSIFAHVGPHKKRLAPVRFYLAYHLAALLGIAAQHRHAAALTPKLHGHRASDTGCGSRHNANFILEPF
ncbi:hypothetical protein GCM10026977_16890 [Hymenobacter qilianensis]